MPGTLAETCHPFLGGNDLPSRWRGQDSLVILDTEFGNGLKFLTTWHTWANDPAACQQLHYIALGAQSTQGTSRWPDPDLASYAALAPYAAALRTAWPPALPGMQRLCLAGGRLILTLVFGHASDWLRRIDASVDAFYLEMAGPATLPPPELARSLARLAAPGATLACRTADSTLREALSSAEFALEAHADQNGDDGPLSARFRSRRPRRHVRPTTREALVIGAGIAGCTVAYSLAARGWQVTVLDQRDTPGDGASGNLAGVLRPLPSADDNRVSRLTRAGFLATRRLLDALPAARWSACGVLHLGRDAAHAAQQARAVAALGWPADVLDWVSAEQASAMLGRALDTGGWWFPGGGWVQPPSLCKAALAAFPERIRFLGGQHVASLKQEGDAWQALSADHRLLAQAPVLIMASGSEAPRFAQFAGLPIRAARGQVTHLPAADLPALPHVVCRHGYTAPAVDGWQLTGATHDSDDADPALRPADHQFNLERLAGMLPGWLPAAPAWSPATLPGRVGFRPMTPDRLPIVGPMPAPSGSQPYPGGPRRPTLPGLYGALGYGARGIVWAALMAELLASQIHGDPLPLERDLVDALAPARFST